jgi:hypothetical protein
MSIQVQTRPGSIIEDAQLQLARVASDVNIDTLFSALHSLQVASSTALRVISPLMGFQVPLFFSPGFLDNPKIAKGKCEALPQDLERVRELISYCDSNSLQDSPEEEELVRLESDMNRLLSSPFCEAAIPTDKDYGSTRTKKAFNKINAQFKVCDTFNQFVSALESDPYFKTENADLFERLERLKNEVAQMPIKIQVQIGSKNISALINDCYQAIGQFVILHRADPKIDITYQNYLDLQAMLHSLDS